MADSIRSASPTLTNGSSVFRVRGRDWRRWRAGGRVAPAIGRRGDKVGTRPTFGVDRVDALDMVGLLRSVEESYDPSVGHTPAASVANASSGAISLFRSAARSLRAVSQCWAGDGSSALPGTPRA